MERKFPNLTVVRHIRDGYQGWIDGVTKIEELFTGSKEVFWQYRVYVPEGSRKVAPEEDLRHDPAVSGLPPKELLGRYVESIEGESDLHALGYNLSDMNPEERQKLLIFCAIPMLGPDKVVKTLCDIIWRKVRRNKPEKIKKYHNALGQWSHDLDFVLSLDYVHLEELEENVLNYVASVMDHLKKFAEIEGGVSVEMIQEAKKRKVSGA